MKVIRSSSGNYGSSGGIDPAAHPSTADSAADPPHPDDLGGFHRRVYWYSFALGFGRGWRPVLLPFYFVINLIPWLSAQYAWPDFGFYASLALNNPLLAVQLVLVPYGRYMPSGHRIRGSLATGAVALILLAFVAVHSPRWVGLALIAGTGTAEAVMEATLFALLGQLSSASYTQAFMAGMGMAGVAAAALALGLHAAIGARVPGLVEVGAYVVVGVVVLLGCVAIHTHLVLVPLIVERIGGSSDSVAAALGGLCAAPGATRSGARAGGGEPPCDDSDTTTLLGSSARATLDSDGGGSPPNGTPAPHEVAVESAAIAAPAISMGASSAEGTGKAEAEHWASALLRVAWAAAHPAAAVAHCFTATFLVYPGILASIPQRSSSATAGSLRLDADAWFSLLLLIYAVCDFAGRSVAGRHRPLPPRALHAYALGRYGLVPILVGCAQGWRGFDADWVAIVAVAAVGLSNGHVATLAVMQQPLEPEEPSQDGCGAPSASRDRQRQLADRDLTGLLLGACLKAGIVAGSDFAILLAGTPGR